MLAAISKTPELALTEAESEQIAKAGINVASFYDLTASAKSMAWANLVMCAGMIYGSRCMAISARLKEEKMRKKAGSGVLINPLAEGQNVSPSVN